MRQVSSRRPILRVACDETESRQRIEGVATSRNLPSRVYASAQDLLQDYDSNWSGCVVIDLRMGRTLGLELQERLLSLGCPLPIIFIGFHGDVKSAVRAMRGGAVTVLERPYRGDELADAVRMAMECEAQRLEARAVREAKRERFAALKPRERLVAQMLAECTPRKAIMQQFGLSLRTVERICARVYETTETEHPVALARLLAELQPLEAASGPAAAKPSSATAEAGVATELILRVDVENSDVATHLTGARNLSHRSVRGV